jgi:hypothetical protein
LENLNRANRLDARVAAAAAAIEFAKQRDIARKHAAEQAQKNWVSSWDNMHMEAGVQAQDALDYSKGSGIAHLYEGLDAFGLRALHCGPTDLVTETHSYKAPTLAALDHADMILVDIRHETDPLEVMDQTMKWIK